MLSTNSKHNIIISAIIIIAIVAIGFVILNKSKQAEEPVIEYPTPNSNTEDDDTISIRSQNINERNFSGTKPVISGEGALVDTANNELESMILEFKTQADKDVPNMREEFGTESPMASYTLDIDAKYLQGPKTESIVMNIYAYTGGANGNSYYNVVTASRKSGRILELKDVVMDGQEAAFTQIVKNKLNGVGSGGAEGLAVFPDVVNDLQFYDFNHWSLDDKNLTLYFAKYEVGPGAMGPVALPLPLSEMEGVLETAF